ncbi:S53 family peptidase [Candidatus Nephthysia bennettiae]
MGRDRPGRLQPLSDSCDPAGRADAGGHPDGLWDRFADLPRPGRFGADHRAARDRRPSQPGRPCRLRSEVRPAPVRRDRQASHFVAAGDHGAYDCGPNRPPSVDFPSALPTVTSVGGTTMFQTPQGTYQKEAAWGNPISEAGTGGGLSQHFKRPAYQKGPGVDNQFSNGNRQVPDVAAVADQNTGYHVVLGGRDHQIGGTSAAAPLWAAVTALIDQDFQKRGLKPVGFANPALYWMAQNGSQLPSPPFHQVTEGNNLAYLAAPGWNYCTGLGSLQAGALESAFEAYQRQGGA